MVVQPDKMDIVTYANSFRAYIERANNPASGILPGGMQIDILWDNSQPFQARMKLISESALLGAVLVMLVLILFLRPIVAFWVTIGIITAFAGGIMLMPLFGVSWNVLSTFAVLLVIGVIVDDAIVVGENIHREVESGRREGLDAAIVGTQLVMKPVVFGVITTIIAFAPWALLTGPTRSFHPADYFRGDRLARILDHRMYVHPASAPVAHEKKRTRPSKMPWRGSSNGSLTACSGLLRTFTSRSSNLPCACATRRLFSSSSSFAFAIMLVGNRIVPFKFMPEIESDLVQVTIDIAGRNAILPHLAGARPAGQAGVTSAKSELNAKWNSQINRDVGDYDGGVIKDASIVASNSRVQAWIGLVPPENRPELLSTREISEKIREMVGPIQDAEEVTFDFHRQ